MSRLSADQQIIVVVIAALVAFAWWTTTRASDEERAVTTYLKAWNAGDGRSACDGMTQAAKDQMTSFTRLGCESVVGLLHSTKAQGGPIGDAAKDLGFRPGPVETIDTPTGTVIKVTEQTAPNLVQRALIERYARELPPPVSGQARALLEDRYLGQMCVSVIAEAERLLVGPLLPCPAA